MKTLVTKTNLLQVCKKLHDAPEVGWDTETYGVEFDDRMFAMQFAIEGESFYFNFHDYRTDAFVLRKETALGMLYEIFNDPKKVWYIHNAKFDLRRLAIENREIKGHVHCTQMCERLIYNQHMQYSLKACLKRIGLAKDDAVEKYITEHKLWEWYIPMGRTSRAKKKFYADVPFDIMFEYGCIDAEAVLVLGKGQREKLKGEDYYENDSALQKVAYKMEEIGMVVRQDYAAKGYEYEKQQEADKVSELSRISGHTFKSGPLWLRRTFDEHGVSYTINEKTGNPIFDKAALGAIEHPIADLIRSHRRHQKYGDTYYATYKKNEIIHAQIKLHGTDTGRFSYADPNLQNVPKEEELDLSIPYQVRGCFKPREDYCFVMVDFDQQEFRLLLDYAGEHELIKRINDHGEDVHQATADMVGVTRTMAKTLNFGLLYGMGAGKLAKALKVSVIEAKGIKQQYFARLPKVKTLINQIIGVAETRKYVKTWCGRKLHFPNKDFAYKAPNHLIQGGCGDIARFAMPAVNTQVLEGIRSRLLLQVHDELLFEVHKDELEIVPALVNIMESTYIPFNGMNLTCGVEHSWESWGKRDVTDGSPVST